MPEVIVKEKTMLEDLQDVRYEMTKAPLNKSGYNKHLNFKYFELADFLPTAIKLLRDKGLCPIFCIGYDSNGIEMATLTLMRGAERIAFTTPTDTPSNMSGIQALGAKHTYLKRYLYMNLLDLTENDIVDASIGEESTPVAEKKATPSQIKKIKELYDEENIAKMLEYYNIASLDEMALKDASNVIARKSK